MRVPLRPLGERSGIVLRVGGHRIVRGDVSKLDVLDEDVLDVETNVVTGNGLGESLMVRDAGFVDILKGLLQFDEFFGTGGFLNIWNFVNLGGVGFAVIVGTKIKIVSRG